MNAPLSDPSMRTVIRATTRGGFVLALAILLLIGVLSYRSNRSLVENQDAILRGQAVLTELNELMVEILEAESAARGFVIAGEQYFQDPYYLTTQVDATIAGLRTLLSDSPSQLQELDSLKSLIAEKLAFHRRMIELRRNSGSRRRLNSSSREEDKCSGTRFAIVWTSWEMSKSASFATGPPWRVADRIDPF